MTIQWSRIFSHSKKNEFPKKSSVTSNVFQPSVLSSLKLHTSGFAKQQLKFYTKGFKSEIVNNLHEHENMSNTNLQAGTKAKREVINHRLRLSNNISAILESLLKDYNNQLRPDLSEGIPTIVKMNMLIRSMGPINEKDMQYSMDCYLRQEWRDKRLSFRGPLKQLSLNIKMLEALWKPDTFFKNGLGSNIHTITRPNKLFRIDQDGHILYSMRLTIKAKCPMELKNFPMDIQSCPLYIGSYAYPEKDVLYEWDKKLVTFEPGMTLSQFDLLDTECKNTSITWPRGEKHSILQVNFILQRHTGYFLIQVYVPCILIVVLSWVSFWINREATSDRVGLGITTVLTLSTISLDTRTDLPKVHYATALDWFILMSFGYCIATLLQFAGVHYFTKIGSGELQMEVEGKRLKDQTGFENKPSLSRRTVPRKYQNRKVNDRQIPCELFMVHLEHQDVASSRSITFEALIDPSQVEVGAHESKRSAETQTDRKDTCCTQLVNCIMGNDRYRRERQQIATQEGSINSVSIIDNLSRVFFPLSYGLINLWYWYLYYYEHEWKPNKSLNVRGSNFY